MALGSSAGNCGLSSSSSSLSASAPPFTIDRFSSKLKSNPNPVLHHDGMSYTAPFGQNWKYGPTPSASQSELEADSMRTTSVPLSNDYTYRGAGSVNSFSTQWPVLNPGDTSSNGGLYVTETRPYSSPFVSKESASVSIGLPMYGPSSVRQSSQVDYNEHLSGVGYNPHWQGAWKGELRNGSPGIEKVNGSSRNEDPSIQSGNATTGDSGNLYGLSTDGIQMASHAGSFNPRIPEGKSSFNKKYDADTYANSIDGDEKDGRSESFNTMNLDGLSNFFYMMNGDSESLYSQNLGHLPFKSSRTQFQGPTSSFPEFSASGTFQGSSECFINNQSTYDSQELCLQQPGSFVKDPTLPLKPTCTVVIKAPAKSTTSARDTHKTVGNKLASNVGSKLQDIPHRLEENGCFMSTRPENIKGSCYTNNSDREGDNRNSVASTSKAEILTNSQVDDSIQFILSSRPPSQITDSNVSHGYSPSFDYVQGYKYTEDPSENDVLALDSPCWKGAQASSSSQNNMIESLPGIQFLKELELDVSDNRVGITGGASQDLSIGNPNFRAGSAANDELPSQTSTSEPTCAAKELNSGDAVKEVNNCQNPQTHKEEQFLNNSGKPWKEHNTEIGLAPGKVNLHAGTEDGVTICNKVADAGAVAYLAAENVLSSPPTQEVSEGHNQSTQEVATKIVDTSALVKAMHSLSEVLHSNCSAHLCELTEENQESLKRVITNLDACVSRKNVGPTPVSEYMELQQSTSISTGGGGDLSKAKGAEQPHQKNHATATSFGELGYKNVHTEKAKYCDYGSQARCLPYFLPSDHNKFISSDNKMVQAIKKVLDGNFNFEEEIQPQALLFKNLWLEAEARLCSITYLAHFDNMRILMDKNSKEKGVTVDTDKAPGSKNSPNSKDTSLIAFLADNGSLLEGIDKSNEVPQQRSVLDTYNSGCQYGSSISTSNPESQINQAEAAVLARLNILKHRDGKPNEVQQQPNAHKTYDSGRRSGSSICTSDLEGQVNHAEAAALAKLNILRQRDRRSSAEEFGNVGTLRAEDLLDLSMCGYGHESLKEFNTGTINDLVIQPARNSSRGKIAGSNESPSSEWEHVQKDYFSWQKG